MASITRPWKCAGGGTPKGTEKPVLSTSTVMNHADSTCPGCGVKEIACYLCDLLPKTQEPSLIMRKTPGKSQLSSHNAPAQSS